jgi:hypothetical protein
MDILVDIVIGLVLVAAGFLIGCYVMTRAIVQGIGSLAERVLRCLFS